MKNRPNSPLSTPFIEKEKNIDCSALHSFKGPFEILHADIAVIRFLAKTTVDQKCCLLLMDHFTSKIYI